jgi:o-succinylbenzoate synthase
MGLQHIISTCQLSLVNYQLKFRQPAGTSRGIYTTRPIWYVLLTSKEQPCRWGIGECAPLPDLSCEAIPEYEEILRDACRQIEKTGVLDTESLRPYPSILFGFETAFKHFEAGSYRLWDTPFSRGEKGIPVNGLIWMGDYRKMYEQIESKLTDGFRCIKLKIGAIHFEEELDLLRHIRKHFSAKDIELRVDANGAFSPGNAFEKLKQLSEFDIHSIEQPIRAGQWDAMAQLTATTPLPIALDEELIGWNYPEDKRRLLETINPQYVILKPSLHGGVTGCNEWIKEAERLGIGWWITSALESNIGLNAIAQWCATLSPQLLSGERKEEKEEGKGNLTVTNTVYQGLGTGGLYTNNIKTPIRIRKDELWFNPSLQSLEEKAENDSGIPPSFIGLGDVFPEWFSPSPYMTVQTSGSTGMPKQLIVKKEQMIQSARQTCAFLRLKKKDKALLCMSLQYIGAKMMVIRSLIAGLELIVREPSGHPMADVDMPIDFAAMVPLQIFNSLQVPEEKERLLQVKKLIIGGGMIDPLLEKELKSFPNEVYSTYGMTETLSHIALRQINGQDASSFYTPFPSVNLTLSIDGTLVVNAPLICDEPLVTNDIAEINPDGSFRILGRKDNVINSGGIKLQIEAIEEKLKPILTRPFAITFVPDMKLGEAVVLLIEGIDHMEEIKKLVVDALPKYEQPRHIYFVETIPITGNSKIGRKACKELAFSIYSGS